MTNFPILYCKKKNGVMTWKIYTIKDTIYVQYGYEDRLCDPIERKVVGKGIGKAKKTDEEQAIKEAEKKWKDKVEEGYYEDLSEVNEMDIKIPLMKAYPLKDKEKKVVYPVYCQPKCDGIRCRAYLEKDKTIILLSSGDKKFKYLEKLKESLLKLIDNKNVILDGELYSHNMSFEHIKSICSRSVKKHKLDDKIEYHLFDIVQSNDTTSKLEDYKTRYKRLKNLFDVYKEKYKDKEKERDNIKLLNTFEIEDKEKLYEYYDKFITQGYEGIIVRNKKGLYKNNRSLDIFKHKSFKDDEFKIVNFKEGKGTEQGCVVWMCITKDKKRFEVRPRGSFIKRQKMFKNPLKYLGKYLTVRYQELSEDGIPRHPVGICIRDYE